MKNPYITYPALITNIESQNSSVKLFTLRPKSNKDIKCEAGLDKIAKCWWPGQFIVLSIAGFGEAPFAICSSPTPCDEFQICVQKKGLLTEKMFNLAVGDNVGFRGPYGNGFPLAKMAKRNIALISGGLGLVPLRPLIHALCNHPGGFGKIQLFGGSREEKLLLFKNEYKTWQKYIELNLTLDAASSNWNGNIGIITTLFDKTALAKNPLVIMCGPPVMFSPVIEKLKKKKVAENDIYVLLERRMHCGLGICQHCVLVNGQYVCKDGPVFNYAEIKDSPGAI
jgi:sulfhydrogenase subunit gamma (sulfur reductase)